MQLFRRAGQKVTFSRELSIVCSSVSRVTAYSGLEPLQKMGVELKVSPKTEEDAKIEQSLDEPSEEIKELVDKIINLDHIELVQFQRRFFRRLGVKRATEELAFHHSIDPRNIRIFLRGGGMGGGGSAVAGSTGDSDAAPAEAAKVKDAFDLKLSGFDAKAKIKIIKEVRAITGLGLKEAKELVEKAPCVLKEGLKKDEAEAFQKVLVEAGAQVELV